MAADDVALADCVELGEYKGLKLTKYVEDITEEKVDATFKNLAAEVSVEDPEAVVEIGDTVNISYYGTVNGETSDAMNSDSFDLQIGSGRFIPGFEDGLIGLRKGDTKVLELASPEDYFKEELAGQPVIFTVTIFDILRVPVQDDAWVENYTQGEHKTVDDFKAYIKDFLTRSAEDNSESQLQSDAWGALYEMAVFKQLPGKFVNQGMETFETNVKTTASSEGFDDLDAYLEDIGITKEDYETYKLNYGKEVAKSRTLVQYVWEQEKFSKEDDLYKDILSDMESEYGMKEEELRTLYGDQAVEDYLMTRYIMQFLIDNADVTVEIQ